MADDFREQVKQKGLKMKKPEESSLEAIYEKTMKDVRIVNNFFFT